MYERVKTNVALPECFIRIDRSHFVKSIHRNLRRGDAKMTKLLRDIIGYLISCADRVAFEQIMTNVFTLIRNKFISTKVTGALSMLLQLVRTHRMDINIIFEGLNEENVDTDSDTAVDCTVDVISHDSTSSYKWVMNCYNSVVIDEDDDEMPVNVYFAPKCEKYIIHSFVRSPL